MHPIEAEAAFDLAVHDRQISRWFLHSDLYTWSRSKWIRNAEDIGWTLFGDADRVRFAIRSVDYASRIWELSLADTKAENYSEAVAYCKKYFNPNTIYSCVTATVSAGIVGVVDRCSVASILPEYYIENGGRVDRVDLQYVVEEAI